MGLVPMAGHLPGKLNKGLSFLNLNLKTLEHFMMIPMETIQDKLLKPPNSPNTPIFFFTYEDTTTMVFSSGRCDSWLNVTVNIKTAYF